MPESMSDDSYRIGLLEGIAAGQEKRLQWLEDQRVRQDERHHRDLMLLREELSKVAASQDKRTGAEDSRKFAFTAAIAICSAILALAAQFFLGG